MIWALVEGINFLGLLVFSLSCPWSGLRKEEFEVIHSFEKSYIRKFIAFKRRERLKNFIVYWLFESLFIQRKKESIFRS